MSAAMRAPWEEACPHCPDGHEPPWRRSWAVIVGTERDHDDQPVTLHVGKTGCQHVAESDAEWLRQVIRDARVAQARIAFQLATAGRR